MAVGNEILELKFKGNDVSPLTVKPHEIAELVISFEKAILIEIKDRHPQFDTTQLLFTFNELKNESLGLGFLPKKISDVVISAFTLISSGFETGDFSQLNNDTIKELKTFTKFSKAYKCSGYFNLGGLTLSSFSPSTEIPYNKNPIAKGDIQIFGRVIDSGGDNPNVHLKINNDEVLIISTTEAYAKELAHKLYEKVALVGAAKWDAITYEIKEFKIKEIVGFVPGNTLSAINELRNITSGFWDKHNTNDDINRQLLRD